MSLLVTRDVAVPMRDGVTLRADVYRPSEGRHPVLLQRTPYGKQSSPGTWPILDPLRAADDGYVVVIQDVRGRFASEGEFEPFVDEALDGHDSVEWAAAQSWSTGDVGLYGSSYMSATQLQAARERPPHLRALAPFEASSDLGEGRSYRGGAFELGALLTIALQALGPGTIRRAAAAGNGLGLSVKDALRGLDRLPELARAGVAGLAEIDVVRKAAPYVLQWAAASDPDGELWRRLRLTDAYAGMPYPMLHLTSWYDQFHVGTLANFEGMVAAGGDAAAEQRLIVGPWNHYVPRGSTMGVLRVGETYFGASALIDMDRLQLAWFDRHLKGKGTGWPFRKPVRLFVMGRNAWRDEDAWPLARARTRELHLGEGTLSWEPAAAGAEAEFVHDGADPVPTRGGAHLVLDALCPQGPVDQAGVQARDDVLVYSGAPLDADLEVTGWVEAALWVDADAQVADFAVVLSDVAQDGRCLNVCDGYARVAGGGGEVTVRLGATAHVFLAGHALRVHVAGSCFPRHASNEGRIRQSVRAPSHLRLPIVEG
jgi:putative CocE/NonD family hydrolase